ncbi:hypothetical protein ACGFX8_34940 [Streptomyces sp. NPDC048362]|uniref:hypothetical protein n=1 Tax=Streptomyces sp. NPDC048362 TaxID=3365539 RepID=UPI00371518AC
MHQSSDSSAEDEDESDPTPPYAPPSSTEDGGVLFQAAQKPILSYSATQHERLMGQWSRDRKTQGYVPKQYKRVVDGQQAAVLKADQLKSLQANEGYPPYTLAGYHTTSSLANLTSLLFEPPAKWRIGSGQGSGKGKGFYVAPVISHVGQTSQIRQHQGPSTEYAIAQAKTWNDHPCLVAVYVRDDVPVISPGEFDARDLTEDQMLKEKIIVVHGPAEAVIYPGAFPYIRCLRNFDDFAYEVVSAYDLMEYQDPGDAVNLHTKSE